MHYIVVLDASASRAENQVQQDQHFVQQLVARLDFCDTITLMHMQEEGFKGYSAPQTIMMPRREESTTDSDEDKRLLGSAQKGASLVVPLFFRQASSERVANTDIFSTLKLVGEKASDKPNEPNTLVLLSDMLQSAEGVEMDHARRMPGAHWIEEHKRSGTLPSLENTCILVIGAEDRNDTDAKVQRFWREYFTAAGTDLKPANYRFTAPGGDTHLCR